MLGQDLTFSSHNYFIYSENNNNKDNKDKIKKNENWFLYLKELLNNSLSKRFLLPCDIINNENCPITLEKINNPVKTSCGHIFEKENIILWIREKKTCPVCRKKLDDD